MQQQQQQQLQLQPEPDMNVDNTVLQQRYDGSAIATLDPPPQTCQIIPGLSLTTSRCEIPYLAPGFTASVAITSSTSSSTPTATTPNTDTSNAGKSAAS